jgi:hypothetical protein
VHRRNWAGGYAATALAEARQWGLDAQTSVVVVV